MLKRVATHQPPRASHETKLIEQLGLRTKNCWRFHASSSAKAKTSGPQHSCMLRPSSAGEGIRCSSLRREDNCSFSEATCAIIALPKARRLSADARIWIRLLPLPPGSESHRYVLEPQRSDAQPALQGSCATCGNHSDPCGQWRSIVDGLSVLMNEKLRISLPATLLGGCG